jgi:hypothetical protein
MKKEPDQFEIRRGLARMELSYENIRKWFETYFDDICKYQGHLATVPKLKKFFASDLEVVMYSIPSPQPRKPMNRDALMISFVHPGLQEDIIPRNYSIDVKQLIVAVQFEIRFSDKPAKKIWAPLQASAHYHLAADENNDLKIRKIHYWTEPLPEDLFEIWALRRETALKEYATGYINSQAG